MEPKKRTISHLTLLAFAAFLASAVSACAQSRKSGTRQDYVHITTQLTEASLNEEPRPDIVKTLLGIGSSINATDQDGNTALIWAVMPSPSSRHSVQWTAANAAVVKLLLAHGADVRIKDNKGNTALSLARGYEKIIRLLQQHGAKE
jgi:hypothetical protein